MTTLIYLNADLKEEGLWENQQRLAEQCRQEKRRILWELDFGLQKEPIAFDDTTLFLSFSLAIDQFTKAFEKEFAEISEGVLLYRGGIDIHERMLWSAALRDHYEEWLEGVRGEETLYYRRLFSMNVFAEYLHRLASFLPDAFKPICSFHLPFHLSRALIAQLLSKERFTHLTLEPLAQEEALIGVVLPPDELCTPEVMQRLDNLFLNFDRENLLFKIIPESFLNEEWQGLETLVAIDSLLTPQGRRMLQGFTAAGGEVRIISE